MIRPDLPIPTPDKPEILAPAGDTACFLAALAAGADNIYLGLKQFSARMQAENFSLTELSRLTDLAHENGTRVTVAMNTLIKDNEVDAAARLLRRLETQVGCDAIIVQDLAMLKVARDAGFTGSITLSTLANITHPAGLELAAHLGADRVVLPREAYEKRRERYERRIQHMLYYAQENNVCRSRLLLTYFGERDAKPCGQCDVCRRSRKGGVSKSDFDTLHAALLQQLAEGASLTLPELAKATGYREEELAQVMRFMLDNDELHTDEGLRFSMK